MREELSEQEHIQWEHWSKSVASQIMDNTLSPFEMGKRFIEKHQKWLPNWIPYSELTEEIKEFDRVWADKIGELIEKKGREAILRLRHDKGSPKGEIWCDGYHEGLADMLNALKVHKPIKGGNK